MIAVKTDENSSNGESFEEKFDTSTKSPPALNTP